MLVGAPGERSQCPRSLEVAANHPGITDRIGSTSIAALLALISRAALVVANDSAALHMAVGCGRPAVALFGPTDTKLVGPYRQTVGILQHRRPGDPIDHKDDANASLMQRITATEALDACRARSNEA